MPNLTALTKQHGDYVKLDAFEFLFADGTHVVGDQHLTLRAPKSPDHGRRQYLLAKLAEEEKNFNDFKAYCAQQSAWHESSPSFCPGPPRDAAKQLLRGRKRIRALRDELAEVEERLGPDPRDEGRRNLAEQHEERMRDSRTLRNEIESVSID